MTDNIRVEKKVTGISTIWKNFNVNGNGNRDFPIFRTNILVVVDINLDIGIVLEVKNVYFIISRVFLEGIKINIEEGVSNVRSNLGINNPGQKEEI